MDDKASLQQLALELEIAYIEHIDPTTIPACLYEAITYSFAKKHVIVPIAQEEYGIKVAFADPLNVVALEELRLLLHQPIIVIVAPEATILEALNFCYHKEGQTSAFLATLTPQSQEKEVSEEYDLLEVKDEAPMIKLLNLILSEAIQQKASDIHFEPFENDMRIRYRIDGVLQNRHAPAREYQSQLLTRIKVLAKLDIAERRLPQDGRIKLNMGGKEIDIRVSTIAVPYGERIVLRILDKGNVLLGLDRLGMPASVLDTFRKIITVPEGIVLVTGPTGSGKTTTLYSVLYQLLSEESNIMTIEDPVEYKIEGIAQIAVHPKIGLSFAAGLRHILRQDPDIVMVGEIRDQETAEIAIQAALTGHLVFSTLHTNDAPCAMTRLMDMGIEPYLLSSTVIGVVAQRLIRTICPHCKKAYKTQPIEKESFAALQMVAPKQLWKGEGCEHCFHTGYKGRQGLYEVLEVTPTLQTLISNKAQAHVLRQAAMLEGMKLLRQHGMDLVAQGMTTIAEVCSVTRGY